MRGGLGRRGRVALAAALPLLALGALAAVVVAGGGEGGAPAGAAHGRGGTQPVERRTLVDRATLDGTLGYGATAAAMDRLGGTITWLPAAGAVIRPGRALFAVDGEPVILMDGRVPAWRTLAAGVADGVDVEQLERNLAALGYDPGTVDESFTSATAAAVSRWQRALGLTQTGRVELGRVVFLPGERRVASVDATLGSAAGGGSGNTPAAWEGGAGARDAYASYETVATTPTTSTTPATPAATTPATTPTTPTTPTTTPATPKTTPTTPRTTPTTPTTPRRSGGGKPSGGGSPASGGDGANGGGDGGGSGSAATKVLTTTSTARVVTAQLDAADQQLARVGVHAVVTLPDGRRVGGRIVRVGTVASSSGDGGAGGKGGDGGTDGGSGETTLPLTIRLRSTRAAGRLDAAPVSVELARETRRDVLAVPVEALLARAGGGYAVRVRRASGTVATVPVQPGLFADGYVELSGGAVRAGDRVEVPR